MAGPDETLPLAAEAAAAVISAQFPNLRPVRAIHLGDGCDHTAFAVNDAWVFRFPKRGDVEAQLLVELQVLPRLAAGAPVAIPAYRFHGQPSPGFLFHFGGYPMLPGTPAVQVEAARAAPAALARDIGRFLSWLHGVPAGELAGLGVPAQDLAGLIDEVRADAIDDFPLLETVAPGAPLDEWFAFVKTGPDATAGSVDTVLLHNDFAAEHVLVDDRAAWVTGVIDWSDMARGDRALDFAGVWHWGGRPLLDAVQRHYGGSLDDGAVERARYLACCRGVSDVAFGVERDRPEYVAAGLRALDLSTAGI